MLCDGTVLVASAGIAQLLPDAAFEETFASFTTDNSVVATCKLKVKTHEDAQAIGRKLFNMLSLIEEWNLVRFYFCEYLLCKTW